MGERYAIDLLTMYVGVEHYNCYDEIGNILEVKEICAYALAREMKGDTSSRRFFVNLDTGDMIKIDQNGDALDYDSEERDIISITKIHSLHEILGELIPNVNDVVRRMDNGIATMDFFIDMKNHMDEMKKQGEPAYMEFDDLSVIVSSIDNLYKLSYGNPLTNENKIRCLYKFQQGGNKNE